jgi:predicted enzyme related to lactoylglutathione lyase
MRPRIVHLELHTPDLTGASAYYRQLLGWAPETVLTRCRPYVSLDAGLSAGIVTCGTQVPVWIPYVEVDDVDAATDHAVSLGATTVLAPREGPHGWRSVVRSAGGGDLAFWQES